MAKKIASAAPEIDPKTGRIMEETGPTGVFERLEAQFEIAAGSMIAGLTNVATVSGGAGPDRIGLSCMASELGLKGDDGYIGAHAIGHGNFQKFAGISGPDCHAHIRRKCLEQLAKFIRRLEAVPEGDGTMLDNTLIVSCPTPPRATIQSVTNGRSFLSATSEGGSNSATATCVIPGMETKAIAPSQNLYLSLLHAVGERQNTFGIPDFGLGDLDQTGPLAEIMS